MLITTAVVTTAATTTAGVVGGVSYVTIISATTDFKAGSRSDRIFYILILLLYGGVRAGSIAVHIQPIDHQAW